MGGGFLVSTLRCKEDMSVAGKQGQGSNWTRYPPTGNSIFNAVMMTFMDKSGTAGYSPGLALVFMLHRQFVVPSFEPQRVRLLNLDSSYLRFLRSGQRPYFRAGVSLQCIKVVAALSNAVTSVNTRWFI